jgi:hypothetical protein
MTNPGAGEEKMRPKVYGVVTEYRCSEHCSSLILGSDRRRCGFGRLSGYNHGTCGFVCGLGTGVTA